MSDDANFDRKGAILENARLKSALHSPILSHFLSQYLYHVWTNSGSENKLNRFSAKSKILSFFGKRRPPVADDALDIYHNENVERQCRIIRGLISDSKVEASRNDILQKFARIGLSV